MGRCPKPRLKPSFGEGFKNSKNLPEKGVPPSHGTRSFYGVKDGGTPFSGEFSESLGPSPKEGPKRGLGQRPKVFPFSFPSA